MKKVFLESLPRWDSGTNKNKINWKNSIGYKVNVVYNELNFEVEIFSYDSKKHKLYIKYLNKDIFEIKISHFKDCNLGKLLGKVTNEFKIEIRTQLKDDKRDLTIIDCEYRIRDKGGRKNNQKWYKYHCNKCNWDEGWCEESNILKGCGCSCCKGLTVVEGINDIPTTAPWMVKYFQGGYDEAKLYTKSSSYKIYPICPDCSKIHNKQKTINSIYNYNSIGCICSDGLSYPNKFTYALLEQLNKTYKFDYLEREYSPDWIKPKRYDNYFEVNNNKYIVEMDGGFHDKYNNMSGQTAEQSKEIDDNKEFKAQEKGIEIIRIDCKESDLEYIKNNIMNSKLNNLFNLNHINWLKCHEFALNNLVKLACEYKRSNDDLTTTDIGQLMNLSSDTIYEYLKKGSKLGWCKYDSKEESKKSHFKKGVKSVNSKQVEIYKESTCLGTFESCHELNRQSENLFGEKLNYGSISSVCLGKTKLYKGFSFKYV